MTDLLELSMYMRGWSGSGPYPIREAPVSNQHLVDINVTQSLAKFIDTCNNLGEIGLIILNLPIMKYISGTFQSSNDPSQGLTIRERLDIIKQGENINNTNSCIRLSSNWLAATYYYYCQIIGMVPLFNIEHLRSIS